MLHGRFDSFHFNAPAVRWRRRGGPRSYRRGKDPQCSGPQVPKLLSLEATRVFVRPTASLATTRPHRAFSLPASPISQAILTSNVSPLGNTPESNQFLLPRYGPCHVSESLQLPDDGQGSLVFARVTKDVRLQLEEEVVDFVQREVARRRLLPRIFCCLFARHKITPLERRVLPRVARHAALRHYPGGRPVVARNRENLGSRAGASPPAHRRCPYPAWPTPARRSCGA